ncbi:MAG: WG repeat-containing protein [Microscillaceae bacterium]|nr:WG repeat-containing protein [Microscillaceae bacterium]
MRILYIFIGLIFCVQPLFADRITGAYKQIQKGDFEKARDLLLKELEKDSLNAGAFHIYSVFFFSENNPAYQIDSAYYFVQKALSNYPNAPEKDAEEWAKEGISQESALKLKANIEAKGFSNARKDHSITAYQSFIDRFPEAQEVKTAITYRDELAWKEAQSQNTMQSYQSFIDRFPNAVQKQEAIQQRDKIIYQRETKSGKLSDYLSFLDQYPNNIFAEEALTGLFDLLAVRHTTETYANFVRKYPDSPPTNLAWDWLIALYRHEKNLESFAKEFPDFNQPKKLEQLIAVEKLQYLPFYEKELYGFLDENGNKRISAEYEYISPEYLCESIQKDYIIINKNGHLGLLDKLGNVLAEPQYDKINPIAPGLFQVTKNAFQGLIHHNGKEILPLQFDAIEPINKYFLKVRKNRRWGLIGHNGSMVIEPEYTEIDALGENFVSFSMGREKGIESNENLILKATEKTGEISLRFDGLELIEGKYLLLKQGNAYGVIDDNSRTIFSINRDQIRYHPGLGWSASKEGVWQVYNPEGKPLNEDKYQEVISSARFLGVKQEGKWGLIDSEGKSVIAAENDSLRFIDQAVLLINKKKKKMVFTAGSSLNETDFTLFKNIRVEKGNYPNAESFVYYEDLKGNKGLFAQNGKKVLSPKYSNVYPLDNDLINVQLLGKYGLVDSLSQLVLPAKYNGITNLTDNPDYKVLLLNNKFGIYHKAKKLLIEPAFDSAPKLFGVPDSNNLLFLVSKGGQNGVVNAANKTQVPFKFNTVAYWNDKRALVETKDGSWTFYNYGTEDKKASPDSLPIYQELEFIRNDSPENIAIISREGLKGIIHSTLGEIVKPQYHKIHNLGTNAHPLFFAERKLEERRIEIVYLNEQGQSIWKTQINDLDYFKLACE